ncbi:hypothetical protein ACFO0O_09410 [Cobetia amphilecti]|mgnify:FL=1|jgi:hypothetical protein|uniref:Uncharacterized protein n=1 Tax=Cobetia amphilecti TaxID=1055104 RepID=A0ABT6UJ93_9GAMM|nr:hypothetical protein [Cobetia amphilecti]MBR9798061.1 hypothetical protein [Gammaproteobacteria bacterium]MDI5882792.1 hypothetical protein [Cobetia amphilecti]|tara:strand:+ start:741 stop:1040 length:300 start_codon:yes stop_codon:yes gene_type:complete
MNRHDEKIIASARKQRALFDELEKALAEELNALDRSSQPAPAAELNHDADEARAQQREAEFVARLESLIAEFDLDREAAQTWLRELEDFKGDADSEESA